MNVLHISYSDSDGGSARSAYRIHTNLRSNDINSHMLVGYKKTHDENVDFISGSRRKEFINRLIGEIGDRIGLQYFTYFFSFSMLSHYWYKQSDIIQIYNIHTNYFNPILLKFFDPKKIIVWRLSDMWPFTGHCTYSYNCEEWKTGCHSCPDLKKEWSIPYNTTRFLWNTKKHLYKNKKIEIVASSRWMEDCAKKSPLFKNINIKYIPNGVDTQVFRIVNKNEAKKILNLPLNKSVILFSAASITDPRKGSTYLFAALKQLWYKKKDIFVVTVGGGKTPDIPYPALHLGNVNNDLLMALAYNAADIFVLPTLAENLPNSILESMACGTPVVAFNIGGVPEVVRHMETGYLCNYKDVDDLSEGIYKLLNNDTLCDTLAKNARYMVENEYGKDLETKRFVELYRELIHV